MSIGVLEELNKNLKTLISAIDALSTSGILAKGEAKERNSAKGKPADDDDDDLLGDEEEKPKAKPASRKRKVSHADLTAKVQPLTDDAETKKKVRAVMDKFGLKRLGDAKEEQYAALWDAFDAIENDSGDDDDDDMI